MYKVTVPSWNHSKPSGTSFKFVSAPSSSNQLKTDAEKGLDNLKQKKRKNPDFEDPSSSSPNKLPKTKENQKPSTQRSAPNPTKPTNKPPSTSTNRELKPTTPKFGKQEKTHRTISIGSSQHKNNNMRSIKQEKKNHHQTKKHEESEDSIDELFKGYPDSGSEISYTSQSTDSSEVDDRSIDNEGFSSGSEDGEAGKIGNQQLSASVLKLKAKLEGGQFRMINEQLYTTKGFEAFSKFQKDPSLFDVYHQGYKVQVAKWPENPLDVFIEFLRKQPKTTVVADFGCGEARLAQSVPQTQVHSFDLVARNKFITACDIANVPLQDQSVEVAIFCLSLMGTNVVDFLKEAFRVLKVGGRLKIAEVKSRFDGYNSFTKGLQKLGFDIKKQDDSNKMFVMFDCVKSERKPKVVPIELKPCIYKRR